MPCTTLQVCSQSVSLSCDRRCPYKYCLEIILYIIKILILYLYVFRDLKEHLRRLQQQSDSRRRAAVMEMMRQRAAEVAGNAG